PGDRVRLSGGYDMEPRWLNGCHSYFGECIGFIPGANGQLAAVIRLDSSISFDSMTGSYVVLQLRYVGARWSKHETVDRPGFRRHLVAIIHGNKRGVYEQQQAVHG